MKRRPRGPRTHNARLHEEGELERRRRAQAKRNPPSPAEEPGDFLFVGGPLHGRYLVTDGAPIFYAPISHDAPPSPSMEVVTYWRRGDRYIARP